MLALHVPTVVTLAASLSSTMTAPGAGGARTVTYRLSLALAPSSSVTVSVTTCMPTESVTIGCAPLPSAAPFSLHAYEVMEPSASLEAEPSSATEASPKLMSTLRSGPAAAAGDTFGVGPAPRTCDSSQS